jgi:uncharacterized protein with PIN domain
MEYKTEMIEDNLVSMSSCPTCNGETSLTLKSYPMRQKHRNIFHIYRCFSCKTDYASTINFKNTL